ncbi:uncharacterized protein KRP23_3014 [Phytophthora ramorum]|uniref:uncharacterized protein n=1 Tax=Phytophthora ramorum TaxID=164328 RepID=UPI0030A1B5B8|nr:hypothetical protein KRP23_3014 [Phytophthora ramorum]
MDDLTTFLNSVESSARKILKQQNQRQQLQAARDRVALVKGSAAAETNGTRHTPTREELRVTEQADDGSLPRLPPPRSPVASVPPGSIYSSLQLPAIARKGANNTPSKRSALKLLESPLYKSLTKLRADTGGFGVPAGTPPGQKLKKTLHEVDNVALLLRKMGLHDSTGAESPAHRADHAVDKRMCNACWAKPDKATGCEHHARVYPNGKTAKGVEGDALAFLTRMELQGPTSWLSGDLFVKYRSEKDREALWLAYVELKEQQQEMEARGSSSAKEQASLAVVPIVTRHPICALFDTLQDLENLRTRSETRKRNLTKTFIFDVNHIWLTNLDHFNHRPTRHRVLDRAPEDESEEIDPEGHSLSDRRDEQAIREGYSQIQSISSTRALKQAVSFERGLSCESQVPAHAALMHSASIRRRKAPSRRATAFRPLSLLVCGRWDPERHPTALERVPGVTLVGNGPALWWRYEPDYEVSEDDEAPPEYTKAVALFERNSALSSSNAILVMLVLALDAPILSPMWFAWHVGSKMPPPELEAAFYSLAEAETGFGRVMAFVSPCLGSLLSTRLESILDDLLPGTITLFNDVAQDEDHWLDLAEPPSAYCSVTIAHPNAPGVCGRYCWHEIDPVEMHLCRRRVEKDLLYVIQNHLTSGPNDPSYFSVALSHESMVDVLGARLSSYLAMVAEREARAAYEKKLHEIEQKLEAGRLALEAKRQEQKRLEQELEAAAAQAEARRKGGLNSATEEAVEQEWAHRLAGSVVLEQQGLWEMREITQDDSAVVFYHSLNEGLPVARRFLWEPPEDWEKTAINDNDDDEACEAPSTCRTTSSKASTASSAVSVVSAKHRGNAEAQATLVHALLEDEQFLQQLKAKLGLSSRSRPTSRATDRQGLVFEGEEGDNDARQIDLNDEMAALTEEGMDRSKSALVAAKMAKLQLQLEPQLERRLQTTEARLEAAQTSRLPPSFARTLYKAHNGGPALELHHQTNHAVLWECSTPQTVRPEDLHEKKTQWVALLRAQQASGTPSSAVRRGAVAVADDDPVDDLFERDPSQQNESKSNAKPERCSARATTTSKAYERLERLNSHRRSHLSCLHLVQLELALDQGVDVNTRDNHGNRSSSSRPAGQQAAGQSCCVATPT